MSKRSLTDFSEFEKSNNETEQENVTETSNIDNEQTEETPGSKTYTEFAEEKEVSNGDTETSDDFLKRFKEKTNKPTIEDTHKRQTYLIRNDLIKEINKLARNRARGFKTELVNYALEKAIQELKK